MLRTSEVQLYSFFKISNNKNETKFSILHAFSFKTILYLDVLSDVSDFLLSYQLPGNKEMENNNRCYICFQMCLFWGLMFPGSLTSVLTEILFLKPLIAFRFVYLDFSKQKEFANDNFMVNENGRKFFKKVKNTPYEQFLLFQQFFSKDLYCRLVKTRASFGKG